MCVTKDVTLPVKEVETVTGSASPVETRKFKDCGQEWCMISKKTTHPKAKDIKPVHDWTPKDGYNYEGGDEDLVKHEREKHQQQQGQGQQQGQ